MDSLVTEIEKFELKISMSATVTVFDPAGQPSDWLKPASEAAYTWRGVPSQEEIVLRYRDLSDVTSITLEDVLVTVRKRLDEVRRNG